MRRDLPSPRSVDRFRRDAERNERARLERLRIDARKSIGQNLEEGAALIALGFEVQRAFEHHAPVRSARSTRGRSCGVWTRPGSSTW